jgi:hypothetical protein
MTLYSQSTIKVQYLYVQKFGHGFGNGMGISIVWSSLISYPTQIYYSVLLYLIQKLATLSSLQQHCTITTTHDKLSCWTGIRSSLSALYNQFLLPVSLSVTLSVTAYLLAVCFECDNTCTIICGDIQLLKLI